MDSRETKYSLCSQFLLLPGDQCALRVFLAVSLVWDWALGSFIAYSCREWPNEHHRIIILRNLLMSFEVVYLHVKECPCRMECFNLRENLYSKVIAEHHWPVCLSLCLNSVLCHKPFFLVFYSLICKHLSCNFNFLPNH